MRRRNNKVDNGAMCCYLLYFTINAVKFISTALIVVLTMWFIASTIDVFVNNTSMHPVFWLGDNNAYNVLVGIIDKLDLIMGWA